MDEISIGLDEGHTYIVRIILKPDLELSVSWRAEAAEGFLKVTNVASVNVGGTRLFHMVLRSVDRVGWPSVWPGCPVDWGW